MIVVLINFIVNLHPLQGASFLNKLDTRVVLLQLNVSPVNIVEEWMVGDAFKPFLRVLL